MLTADFFAQTSWLIPCYPLVGALLSVFWSPAFIQRTGPRPVGYLNLLLTVVALVHSSIAFAAMWGQPAQFLALPWLQVADLNLTIPLELSALTLGASVVITILNLLVQIYTVGYLEMDWGWGRMYSLLALFEAGLTALVLCDSLFFSYILLEILTLGTYLIVGFLVQSVSGGDGRSRCLFDQAGWRFNFADGRAGALSAGGDVELY